MVWSIFCSRIDRFQTIWLKLREGDCTTNFGAISLSSWTSRNVPLFWLPCSVECNLSSCGNCCFLRRLDSEKTLTTKGGGRRLLVFFKLVIYKSSKYDHIELHKKLWMFWTLEIDFWEHTESQWIERRVGKKHSIPIMKWEKIVCVLLNFGGNDYYFLENK